MVCDQCGSELRVKNGGDVTYKGQKCILQYYYCIRHGDRYKKYTAPDGEITIIKI